MRSALAAAVVAVILGGCTSPPTWNDAPECQPLQAAPAEPAAGYANPVFIPIADPQNAWETVVGVVNAYFRVQQEEPIRMVGNVWEGTITSLPEVSPTIFEPWRYDTVDHEQRVENTLQSMRRQAVVRVTSAQGGHMVEVRVFKYLEDVHPEHATAGEATFRYDTSLTRVENPVGGEPITKGWIPQGRDALMEQYMIGDLLNRCGQVVR